MIPNFPPTFKYNAKTFEFHESNKTPSWTDRIFFKLIGNDFNIFDYSSCSIYLSDHFPVFLFCELGII